MFWPLSVAVVVISARRRRWRLELRPAASKRAVHHGGNGAMNLDVRTDQIKSLELAGYSLQLLLLVFDRPW